MYHRLQGIANLPFLCQKLGVHNVVLCPGSRSAPITYAFTECSTRCYSIIDERSAAYFALGLAIATKEPIAVVCTSGTSTLNFAPAVAEAYYQQLPLIVLTADRPAEWIDQNDGQTLNQKNIYQNYCLASYSTPPEQEKEDDLWHFTNIISKAVAIANGIKKGPVHINIPITEPLYIELPTPNIDYLVERIIPHVSLENTIAQSIIHDWQQYSRRMIVCGFNLPDQKLQESIDNLLTNNQAVVIAENIANIHHPDIICNPDPLLHYLENNETKNIVPELLITIGNSIVSKRLKTFLRSNKTIIHWHIDESGELIDTYKLLKKVIPLKPNDFFQLVESHPAQTDNRYTLAWKNANEEFKTKRDAFFLENNTFADLTVLQNIHDRLSGEYNIHISNSTSIRSSQLLQAISNAHYYCNRGTSGIDGSSSTAVGFANASLKATILFTGDLSFFYDSNGLWNKHIPDTFKIVLFNNAGGNIFKLLPTNKISEKAKEFIFTAHNAKAKGIAIGYNFMYFYADNFSDLNKTVSDFLLCETPSLIEISTDSEINANTFKEFYKYILS